MAQSSCNELSSSNSEYNIVLPQKYVNKKLGIGIPPVD